MKTKALYSLMLFCTIVLATTAKENKGTLRKPASQSQLASNCPKTTAQTDLNINNVRARILNGGDMWWDPISMTNYYEVPNGSGKNSIFSGALWIGGFTSTLSLKIAAQTYRQQGANDFWSGPISKDVSTGVISITTTACAQYDRFWGVTKTEVQTFVNGGAATQNIIDWPGNGNIANGELPFLAPFFDANNDGVYNYVQGDYPLFNLSGTAPTGNCYDYLLGDKSIWWVFNDIGNIHTETNGDPIGLEIRSQAFAFNSTNPSINNATFYKYQIINRASDSLLHVHLGQWVDPDLGNAVDDYVGCDVGLGLGYCYNSDPDDEVVNGGYGLNPPAVGTDFLQGPLADANDTLDNDLDGIIDEPGEECTMSKFIYYKNTNQTPDGNPFVTDDYFQYLEGHWLDGGKITFGGDGRTNQMNPECSFMFPGITDPSFPGQNWDMGSSGIAGNDMRYLQSVGPFSLAPGEVNYVTIGTVWARGTNGPQSSIVALQAADNDVQALFNNCFVPIGIEENEALINVNCSPNPFTDQAFISFNNDNNRNISLQVYDMKGTLVRNVAATISNSFKIERKGMDAGIYLYRLISNGKTLYSGKIVVQ